MSRIVLVTCGALMLCASTARAVLVHQYTFNGDANDSVGGQDGTVVDPLVISNYVGGQLDLTGNNNISSNTPETGAYVNLPNGIVSAAIADGQSKAASFEMWVTVQENRFWARLFDFGSSNLGEDSSASGAEADYMQMVPLGFTNQFAFETHPAFTDGTTIVSGVVATASPLTTGVQHHVVVTYDQLDNTNPARPGGTARIFLDGAPVATGPISTSMPGGPANPSGTFNDNNNWLGRAQWPDPLLDGLYNEFRIYNHAMSAAEVTTSFNAGPVPPPLPTLIIDRSTGAVSIKNATGSSQLISSYSISSAIGGLLVAPAWDPVAPVSGWTIQTQTANQLAEHGGTAINLPGGGSQTLGTPWLKSPFEDLTFSVSLNGAPAVLAAVQYIGNNGVSFARSDLNTDGSINAADWVVFLDGNADNLSGLSDVAQYFKGDLNGDNLSNHADFVLFRQDFIAVNGAAAFAALVGSVPEPSAIVLVYLSLVGLAPLRSRHHFASLSPQSEAH
ncbi:MAG: LamG-like jellyroll fold domain-containing protein [Pirellulales bacterium]